ncbi:MAG: hypothetical protein ACHQPI_06515 [Thermoanaerobaculia bacterium]
MRVETAAFDRAAAVRDAVLGWRRAGVLDDRTSNQIRKGFPDPRVRPSWIWRALTSLLVTFIVLGVLLALSATGVRESSGMAFLCFVVGGACAVATELQESNPALSLRGGAGATAFWSAFLLVMAAGLAFEALGPRRGESLVDFALAVSVLLFGTASWRWGSAVFALVSAASLFLFLARQPSGRLFVLALGLVLAVLAWRRLDAAALPPPHRESAATLLVASLAALYSAVNYWSVETWWIERLRPGFSWTARSGNLLLLSAFATALLPVGILVLGIRTRRLVLIDTGAVLVILSVLTLRHYIHLAPLWVILAVAGTILLAVALALERWLSRGPGKERSGFTAEALFSDETRARLLQAIPVVTTLSPSAPPPPERGFTPGGGSFGGGGASDRF